MIAEVIAAAVGTISFSLIFGVPRKYYPLCGLTGATSWLVYRCLVGQAVGETAASFFASLLVIILSRLFAVRCRCPVTVFLIAGIIPLVPGAGIYWCAYYLVTNQIDKAAQRGYLALKAAVAIVLGIVIAFEIPQKCFQIGMKKE